MPVVVATITPKSGKVDEAEAAIKEIIPLVHEEPGCELYALHRSGDVLVMVEKWADNDALDVHSKGDNLRRLGKSLADLTERRPDVRLLQAVPAGDAAKGAV